MREAFGGGWTWREEGGGGVGGDRGWTPHADVSVKLALRLGRTRMFQLEPALQAGSSTSGDTTAASSGHGGEDPSAKQQQRSGSRLQASSATPPACPRARATSLLDLRLLGERLLPRLTLSSGRPATVAHSFSGGGGSPRPAAALARGPPPPGEAWHFYCRVSVPVIAHPPDKACRRCRVRRSTAAAGRRRHDCTLCMQLFHASCPRRKKARFFDSRETPHHDIHHRFHPSPRARRASPPPP